ncbi:leishmanolysin-like peptidase [Saccoglossus kowalevskii]
MGAAILNILEDNPSGPIDFQGSRSCKAFRTNSCVIWRMVKVAELGTLDVRHTYLEAHHVIKKRTADQSIRIYVWYDGSVNDLESPKRNLIKNELIPQAIDYFSNAFQVKPTGVPIRLSRTCSNSYQMLPGEPYEYCTDTCAEETTCGYVTVPQQHLQVCIWASFIQQLVLLSSANGKSPIPLTLNMYDYWSSRTFPFHSFPFKNKASALFTSVTIKYTYMSFC